jgi:hypothetical protein
VINGSMFMEVVQCCRGAIDVVHLCLIVDVVVRPAAAAAAA